MTKLLQFTPILNQPDEDDLRKAEQQTKFVFDFKQLFELLAATDCKE